jgi:environmental stress-induced protein Ves
VSEGRRPAVVRYADLKTQPWRNGGGTTREIARGPAGAAPDAWGWRLSIADVDRAGDFSAFEGMERILTVVEGGLLLLTVDGREQGLERHRPFRFDGGAATSAALPTGPIRDLNVITGADHRAYVAVVELSKKRPHPVFGGQLAVLLEGTATAGSPGGSDAEPVNLARYDAVIGGDDAPPEVSGRGFLAVVSIEAASTDAG